MMEFYKHTLQILLLTTLTLKSTCLKVSHSTIERNEDVCRKLTRRNNFQENFLLGLPWRTYYTWLVNLGTTCHSVTFKKPSKKNLRYYSKTIGPYVEGVDWQAATILGVIEQDHQDILMFPVANHPGRYRAIPNVIKGIHDKVDRHYTLQDGVPILRFGFKLYQVGRFLLRWDCVGGIGHLMARPDTVNHTEVMAMVQALNLGVGHLSCIEDKKKPQIKIGRNVTSHE